MMRFIQNKYKYWQTSLKIWYFAILKDFEVEQKQTAIKIYFIKSIIEHHKEFSIFICEKYWLVAASAQYL